MISHILQLKVDQISILIAKDFKLKYNATALGFVWSLMMPALTSIIYYFVFGVMMRFNAPNYLLYLMSGSFLWQFFANVIMQNGGVLMSNQGLLKKTSFDRELLIWGTFFTESIHFVLTVPVLIVMMICYGIHPNILTIIPNLIAVFVSLAFFSVGFSYAYAAVNLFFRDLERIMSIFIMMWMFLSPVFIPMDAVPEEFLMIYKLNPMARIMELWRDVFYAPGWHLENILIVLPISLAVFFVGRAIFRKMEPGFAEMM